MCDYSHPLARKQLTCAKLPSVVCLDIRYYKALFHKLHKFQLSFLNFSINISEKLLIIRRTERDMIKNFNWSLRNSPVIIVIFNENLIFLTVFQRI